jgi:hypothetical protein
LPGYFAWPHVDGFHYAVKYLCFNKVSGKRKGSLDKSKYLKLLVGWITYRSGLNEGTFTSSSGLIDSIVFDQMAAERYSTVEY